MPRNIEAGRRAGKAIETAVNSVSLTAAQEKGLVGGVQQALLINNKLVAEVRFELTTFGL
jgi:hypothetical protein